MPKIMGIDPGKKGGIALIDTDAWTVAVVDMPVEAATKGRDLASPTGIARLIYSGDPDHIFVEEVGVRPEEGAVGAFSFGRGFGRIEGAAAGAMCALTLVRPQDWKRALRVPADKAQAVTRANQLFPGAAVAGAFSGPRGGVKDGRAEASMIGFFGCLKLNLVPTQRLTFIEYPT